MVILWKIWLSGTRLTDTTLRAAVHLGKDYEANLRFVKNHLWRSARQLFSDTKKLISGQTGTSGISLIASLRFKMDIDKLIAQSSLSSIFQLPKSTSSPTLCSAWEKWKTILLNPGRGKFNGIRTTVYFKELNLIDGPPVEFEWKIFQGFGTVGMLNQIQQTMGITV